MPTEMLPALLADPRVLGMGGLALLAVLLAACVASDVASYRIPNAVVLPGAAAGVLLHAALPFGFGLADPALPGGIGLLQSLAGLAVGLLALLPLWLLRAGGAGDVKLMAMVGAFLGPAGVLGAALLTFVAGALLALGAAARRGALGRLARNVRLIVYAAAGRLAAVQGPEFDARADSVGRVPYSLAIALGTGGWIAWGALA